VKSWTEGTFFSDGNAEGSAAVAPPPDPHHPTDPGKDAGVAPVDSEIAEQAALLERAFPACMRQIFAIDPAHPLADLPFGQYRLCILLFREGKRTMSQVSEDLGISVSAVTQMADRLEKSGLVERQAEPSGDRRTRFLQLTDYGQSLMQSRTQIRLARASAVLSQLTGEQRRAVLDALETLRDASKTLPPYPATEPREGQENR
jgi:MarR family transcriptional regulator, organic hydroperoxide resistance regulator